MEHQYIRFKLYARKKYFLSTEIFHSVFAEPFHNRTFMLDAYVILVFDVQTDQ
jgi:hypothetical protein